MLTLIETEINDISRLLRYKKTIKTDEYICKHYDTYKSEYEKCNQMIEKKAQKLEELLDEYIGYDKFLWFKDGNKVKKHNGLFNTYAIHIHNNNSKEYYCIRTLFSHIKELYSIGTNKWIIDWW